MDKLDHMSGAGAEGVHSPPRLARDSASLAVLKIDKTEIKLLPSKIWISNGEIVKQLEVATIITLAGLENEVERHNHILVSSAKRNSAWLRVPGLCQATWMKTHHPLIASAR